MRCYRLGGTPPTPNRSACMGLGSRRRDPCGLESGLSKHDPWTAPSRFRACHVDIRQASRANLGPPDQDCETISPHWPIHVAYCRLFGLHSPHPVVKTWPDGKLAVWCFVLSLCSKDFHLKLLFFCLCIYIPFTVAYCLCKFRGLQTCKTRLGDTSRQSPFQEMRLGGGIGAGGFLRVLFRERKWTWNECFPSFLLWGSTRGLQV